MMQTVKRTFFICTALILLAVLCAPPALADGKSLKDFPFWKMSAGWWESENTYFDNAMNYNIRAYNSLVHVEIDGGSMRETEYKFYAPSKLAAGYGKGLIKDDEGIEVVTVATGALSDNAGTVRITQLSPGSSTPDEMFIKLLDKDTAVRIVPDKTSGVDTYRMFITLPTPNKRYLANFGIVSKAGDEHGDLGDLRGFSIFRATRFKDADFGRLRAELRAKNKVHAIQTAGPDNQPVVQRLD